MALDRWIALIILLICLAYGYTAFFTMDQLLPPILQRSPVWPSSFPKVLFVGGAFFSLIVLLGLEKTPEKDRAPDINLSRLGDYNFGQAIVLIAVMIGYALLLRPLGFLLSTFLFLMIGSFALGERRYLIMSIVAVTASVSIWYLVEKVLGIFLRPLPLMLTGG